MMERKQTKHAGLSLPRQDGSAESKREYNRVYYELIERFHPRRHLHHA